LEEQLLGKTYLHMPVNQRLAQLEQRAFGKASDLTDLSARVDALKQYVLSHGAGNEDYLSATQTVGAKSGSLVQEVSEMEMEVFGKTYAR
ncbi:hypothetical protein ABTK33_20400, partial [Acinetobacter baumannii]